MRGVTRGALAAGALVLLGCARRGESSASSGGEGAPAVASAAAQPASSVAAPPALGSEVAAEDATAAGTGAESLGADPRVWQSAAPVSGKAVGNTSVAFKLKLEGELTALYKPRSRRHDGRYRGEIAAYRLATALGLGEHVPPAYPRTFGMAALRRALGDGSPAAALLDAEAIPSHGQVPGALLPWRPRFDVLPLEKPAWRAKWSAWLGAGPLPRGADRRLARQIASMVLFDYVTGNWDRWSGGNIAIDEPTGTVLFVDNDAAFSEDPPKAVTVEQRALVKSMARFPRGLVDALTSLNEESLGRILGDESPGVPLLTEPSRAGVLRRRAEVVSHVQAVAARRGQDAAFPFEEPR